MGLHLSYTIAYFGTAVLPKSVKNLIKRGLTYTKVSKRLHVNIITKYGEKRDNNFC